MKKFGLDRGASVVRLAKENKASVVTASLVIYLAGYLFLGIAGVSIQAQPAASVTAPYMGDAGTDEPDCTAGQVVEGGLEAVGVAGWVSNPAGNALCSAGDVATGANVGGPGDDDVSCPTDESWGSSCDSERVYYEVVGGECVQKTETRSPPGKTSKSTACSNTCGTASDGCGGTYQCGGATTTDEACGSKECGTATNSCGTSFNCGSCSGGEGCISGECTSCSSNNQCVGPKWVTFTYNAGTNGCIVESQERIVGKCGVECKSDDDCSAGQTCSSYSCVEEENVCGNGVCEAGESGSCSQDCDQQPGGGGGGGGGGGSGVSGVNTEPVASFSVSAASPSPGQDITFDGTNSRDIDGTLTSYEWDWTSDGSYDATGATATHSYSSVGTYEVTLRVTDDDGSTATESTTVSVTDTTPPTVSASAPSGWLQRPQTVTLSGSDSGTGIDRFRSCIGDGCDPASGRTGSSRTVSSEGINTVRFDAVDGVGNAPSAKEITVKIDLTAPAPTVSVSKTLSGEPYTGGWSAEPVKLGTRCSDTPSGCTADTRLKLVGGPGVCPGEGDRFASGTLDTYNTAVGTVLGDESGEDGTYYVCAGATDQAGNTGFGGASPDAETVRVDTTSPEVTASTTSPVNDSRQQVNYTVDEEHLNTTGATGAGVGWSCTESDPDGDNVYQGECQPQSDIPDGHHTVNVSAMDHAGNNGSAAVSLTVDTTAPSVTCDECAQPDPIRGGNDVQFDPVVVDPITSVDSVEICEDNRGSPNCSDLYCSGDPCTFTTPENTFETRDFWIRATDIVGNTRKTGPRNFTIKKWIGDRCSSDDACLLGSCVADEETGQRVCGATIIPEPGIFLR